MGRGLRNVALEFWDQRHCYIAESLPLEGHLALYFYKIFNYGLWKGMQHFIHIEFFL